MKVKIPGYIVWRKHSWEREATVTFYPYRPTEDKECIVVREHTIEVDFPDNFDPVPYQVRALQAEMKSLQAETEKKLTELKVEINNLLCVGYTIIDEVRE